MNDAVEASCIIGAMNYANWYERISSRYSNDGSRRALSTIDRALVYLYAGSYVVLLVFLAATDMSRLPRAVIVPALTFAFVTVVRAFINKPRPYESWPIKPVIAKNTQGKSMPSRHMSSAVVISCAIAWVNPALGCVFFLGCAVIAFTRIVGGVHYPSDIAVATIVALLFGIVGFFLIP